MDGNGGIITLGGGGIVGGGDRSGVVGDGIVVGGAEVGGKQRNWRRVFLRVGVLVGVVGLLGVVLWIFVLSPLMLTSKEDAKVIVADFTGKYSVLLDEYDKYLNLGPENWAAMAWSDDYFVITKANLRQLISSVADIQESKNAFVVTTPKLRFVGEDINEPFNAAKERALTTLGIIEGNVALLKRFSDTYVRDSYDRDMCGMDTASLALTNDDDAKIAKVASVYNEALCGYVFRDESLASRIRTKEGLMRAKTGIVRMLGAVEQRAAGLEDLRAVEGLL